MPDKLFFKEKGFKGTMGKNQVFQSFAVQSVSSYRTGSNFWTSDSHYRILKLILHSKIKYFYFL